jgi:hypothetical protein
VGTFTRRGNSRVFWLGYAVFGGGYTLAAVGYNVPLVTNTVLDWFQQLRTPRFLWAKVSAQWTDGVYYPATIVEIRGGQYRVAWDGGAPDS